MNHHEAKQEDRKQYYLDKADQLDRDANAAHDRSNAAVAGIPLGQPILVGHHSEGRHRRDIARSHKAMDKSMELTRKAKYYREKAASVGHAGISSDDPEAVQKLVQKVERAEQMQTMMKGANKAIRKALGRKPAEATDEQKAAAVAALVELGATEANAAQLIAPDFCGRFGFASYHLTNNNANIKRMKKRINELRAANEAAENPAADIEREGYTVRQNHEANRVQFLFDDKPAEDVRSLLKSYGFRWAPSQSAWQRQLNGNSRHAARQVLAKLDENQ